MALFYLFPFSLLILLAHAHNVVVKWMPKPEGEGFNLVFYGITIDGKVEQPLTITPGDEDNSPHFFYKFMGMPSERELKREYRHRYREMHQKRMPSESELIKRLITRKEEYLCIRDKDSNSRRVDFDHYAKGQKPVHRDTHLDTFADNIADGNVYYKSQTDTIFRKLGAAHIIWDSIAVAFDDIFNTAKPKLNALFKQYLESEKTVQNYNLYVEVSAMQKLVGEDAQKQRMTEIYNDLIEPAASSVSDDTKKKLTESKARTSAWTDENGEFIGSGVDDNGKGVEDNPWYKAKEEMKTLMKDMGGFKKTMRFREWVRKSGEYSLRYNEDFQLTDKQKKKNVIAELKLALAGGYKAGLNAEKKKKLDRKALLRRKYRW